MNSTIRALLRALALLTVSVAASAQNCPFGTEQCKQGLVWREAFTGDKVCVTGTSRNRAVVDNRERDIRRLPNSDECVNGFVWREAGKGRNTVQDRACVLPSTRQATWEENDLADKNIDPKCTARAQCEARCQTIYSNCLKPRQSPADRQDCIDGRNECKGRC